ncbi:M16 family metallopeptidase [Pseudorhodoferax sp.]|uniref:M16 family metallopeptidase n=1 Tax=Pseudorhodoferax sp. TaxID=1993553 RepID=UPI002DD657B1|nr:insulinase family protein [Pseudorhodoferax sp.]
MTLGIGLAAPAGWAQVPAATAVTQAGPPWAHEQVQRSPDPAVRFGRLPNGLRYALQHNETPRDGVSMRLRIGSGSLQEREGEQGLAHFLEHMAFRGSAKVADGEVVHMLQRQGLAFGPDTNASTGLDQTIYFFNFPKADQEALDTGLLLFREIAEHLALDPQRIEQEKGVVLAEIRARDVPPQRAQQADIAHSLAGTLVPERWPGGKVEAVQAATAEKLRRYYAANYRPDNATLVIVGNIDVDAVERQLRQQFGDWHSRAPADAPALGTPQPPRQSAEFVAEGVPDLLALTWLLPPDNRAPTLAVEREQLVAQLGVGVLNMRLVDRTLQPGSPFLQAMGTLDPSVFKVAGQARMVVAAPAAQWPAALDAALAELRLLLGRGVQPADLQRLLPAVRSSLQVAVAQSPTRQHAAIADALVQSDLAGAVYLSAQQTQAEVDAMLAKVSAEEITAALRRSFGGSPLLLFRSAHAEPVGAEALTRQLAQASQRPLAAQAATNASWPYTDFGAPSAISTRTTDAALGTTFVEFANGTRLVVKSTPQERGLVGVQVWLGQGRAGLKPEQTHALWALDSMPLGGTGQRSLPELMQWLQIQGKQLNVALRVDPQAFVLLGNAAPADLTAQLQVLAAYARDPGFRPELGERLQAVGPMVANQIETQAGAVYGRAVLQTMNGGDARLSGAPTPADIAATRPDDLPAVLRAPLAGAADVVVVGDIGVDAAVAAVQATFGAGPTRPRLPRADLQVKGPAGGAAPIVVTHLGQPEQAIVGWHWAMPDHWADPALAATGRVAAAVLQSRLDDTVRSQLGITYSPAVGSGASLEVPGQGSFSAQIETPPAKFATFRTLLRAELDALASRPVAADELRRARQPLVESQHKNSQTNGHWSFWLPQILNEPRAKAAMLGEVDALQAVTAEQVQAFFRDRIANRSPVEISTRAKTAPAGN